MSGDIILLLIVFGLGVLVGLNIRHELTRAEYNKTFERVDETVRKKLIVAQNLVQSLNEDKNLLREKIWHLEQEIKNDKIKQTIKSK
jgi:hypothetical protein